MNSTVIEQGKLVVQSIPSTSALDLTMPRDIQPQDTGVELIFEADKLISRFYPIDSKGLCEQQLQATGWDRCKSILSGRDVLRGYRGGSRCRLKVEGSVSFL